MGLDQADQSQKRGRKQRSCPISNHTYAQPPLTELNSRCQEVDQTSRCCPSHLKWDI